MCDQNFNGESIWRLARAKKAALPLFWQLFQISLAVLRICRYSFLTSSIFNNENPVDILIYSYIIPCIQCLIRCIYPDIFTNFTSFVFLPNSLYMPYSIASPALMTPAGMLPRYSVASSPTTYQLPTNQAYMTPQYIMQPPLAAHVSTFVRPWAGRSK